MPTFGQDLSRQLALCWPCELLTQAGPVSKARGHGGAPICGVRFGGLEGIDFDHVFAVPIFFHQGLLGIVMMGESWTRWGLGLFLSKTIITPVTMPMERSARLKLHTIL